MPSGQTHDRITLWSLPWVVGVSLLFTRSCELTLIIAGAFLFSGLMFGPDLDIYSIQFKRWGKLRFIWVPYQKVLRHRSLLSHGLIIGTIVRVVYLSIILLPLGIMGVALAQFLWGFDSNWQEFIVTGVRGVVGEYPGEAIALFAGLELGAMSHSISDTIGSAWKRYRKKQPKKKTRRTRRRS